MFLKMQISVFSKLKLRCNYYFCRLKKDPHLILLVSFESVIDYPQPQSINEVIFEENLSCQLAAVELIYYTKVSKCREAWRTAVRQESIKTGGKNCCRRKARKVERQKMTAVQGLPTLLPDRFTALNISMSCCFTVHYINCWHKTFN